jgi:hypothetical protein
MKLVCYIILLVIISLLPICNYAQEDTTNDDKHNQSKYYLNLGFGLGTSSGIVAGYGLNYILPNNWGVSLSSNYYYKEAAYLPYNYRASDMDFIPEFDITHSYSIRLLKEFQLKSSVYRFGIECGPSYIVYSEAHFTAVPNWNTLIFKGSNYQKSYTDQNIYGLSVRAKFESLFSRVCGTEFAIISNINKYQSYIGFEIHFLFGKIRDKIILNTK